VHTDYDVVVAGLGAFGSATARALARRGARVLGLDPHAPPHDRGSSHGRTRIIREALFEDPLYVPLVRQAFQGWKALEAEAGIELFRPTGALAIGLPASELVRGVLESARTHDLAHEVLAAGELERRFPALSVSSDQVAVLEHRAGVLMVEACIRAALGGAAAAGAELRTGEALTGWEVAGDHVVVTTAGGPVRAGALVLALGAWMGQAYGAGGGAFLTVERQVVQWFEPARHPARFRSDALPVVLWEFGPEEFFYAIPDTGEGLKAGLHHGGAVVTPDRVDREVSEGEARALHEVMVRILPDAGGRSLGSSVCLYTNTPDRHLLLGRHPEHARVVLAGGGSGHGFKYAPAVGDIAAALALGEGTPAMADGLARRLAPVRVFEG
jgi:sarcosine oxidase